MYTIIWGCVHTVKSIALSFHSLVSNLDAMEKIKVVDEVLCIFWQEYLDIPNLKNVDGLAFDWIYKNLYWTDSTTSTVNMASKIGINDTWLSRELYRYSEQTCGSFSSYQNATVVCLQKPRSIVVEPLKVM